MSKSLPLEEMTLQEKLAAMESVWEDIAGSTKRDDSPGWHKDILDERAKRLATGEACFDDWETAKAKLRKKLEWKLRSSMKHNRILKDFHFYDKMTTGLGLFIFRHRFINCLRGIHPIV